jgi:hypothetical protein
LSLLSLLSLPLTVPQQIPTHTPYKSHNLQLHQTQNFSAFCSQLVLYTMSFYWHPQILLYNKLNWFTYSFIQFIYVSLGYRNIKLLTYMYLCMYVP